MGANSSSPAGWTVLLELGGGNWVLELLEQVVRKGRPQWKSMDFALVLGEQTVELSGLWAGGERFG